MIIIIRFKNQRTPLIKYFHIIGFCSNDRGGEEEIVVTIIISGERAVPSPESSGIEIVPLSELL